MASFRVDRIEMNSAGAKELLQGPESLALVTEKAHVIADAAGGEPDFEVQSRVGSARARASVVTATSAGRRAEAEERRLSQAIDAARG